MATGFKIAEHFDIESIIEVYQPDPDVKQSIITLLYLQNWPKGAAFYEWPIQTALTTKQEKLSKTLFTEFLPYATKTAQRLPPKKKATKPIKAAPKAKPAAKPAAKPVKQQDKTTKVNVAAAKPQTIETMLKEST